MGGEPTSKSREDVGHEPVSWNGEVIGYKPNPKIQGFLEIQLNSCNCIKLGPFELWALNRFNPKPIISYLIVYDNIDVAWVAKKSVPRGINKVSKPTNTSQKKFESSVIVVAPYNWNFNVRE